MAPGAIPHPGRVPEQRLLSPEIGLRWWWHCGTFRGRRLDNLGFSHRRDFIGGRAMSEGGQGAHTTPWRGQRGGGTTRWCGCLLALLRLFFGLRLVSGKIGTSGFISSNSGIFLCNFSKTQKQQKTGTGTVVSC
jgi:hypothetical protein